MPEPVDEQLLDALAKQGWCVLPAFLCADEVAALAAACRERHDAGHFHRAGVGPGQPRLLSELRGDRVQWIDAHDPSVAVQGYLARMEALRRSVNEAFFLGLVELEVHFALYPPGACYQRHLDRFRDDDRRTLSVILYLNAAWREEDGGALRLWLGEDGQAEHRDILPHGGTLVAFLAERFWHEVLPARRERLSLTGWFKRR